MLHAADIAAVLRTRIISGLHLELRSPGDRLPGVRQLAAEFDADPRTVLAAYRTLVAEGIVTIRPRSGIYIAEGVHESGTMLQPLDRWYVDVLAHGIANGIGAQRLGRRLRRAVASIPLRAACIECNADQMYSTMRELHRDYGLDPVAVDTRVLQRGAVLPNVLSEVDLLVTTVFHARLARSIARRTGQPCVVVSVDPDLVRRASEILVREPVYFLVSDPRFARKLPRFFASAPGVRNVKPLVVGRDDLGQIPSDARVYVMGRARVVLKDTPVPGRVISNVRVFSPESARELLTHIVRMNGEAALPSDAPRSS